MTGRSVRDLGALGLRRAQARALALLGLTRRALARRSGSVGVLMYHRVLPDDAPSRGVAPGMFVRASTFERQVRWLRERFRIVTLGEALEHPPAADGKPVVVLTFDDGWRDNLEVAWPVLDRLGVRGTIFVVRDWCAAGESPEGKFLRPEEIRALASRGVEFGAHTAAHPHLDRLDDRDAESEMRRSKEAVEEWTGRACPLFAYPFGDHNARTAALARRLFVGSVLADGGWWDGNGDLSRIPRIAIHQDMTSTRALFEARLAARM